MLNLLHFIVGNNDLGVEIGYIRGIIRMPAEAERAGDGGQAFETIRFRDEKLKIFDSNIILGSGKACASAGARVLVMNFKGENFGLKVEKVGQVIQAEEGELTPADAGRWGTPDIKGALNIGEKRLLLLLDMENFHKTKIAGSMKGKP